MDSATARSTQINKDNVGNLQVAWTFSTGVLRGHEGGPLVIGDTMWIHTPFPNKVFSINLADQSINWIYEPKQDAAAMVPVMCCDTGLPRPRPRRRQDLPAAGGYHAGGASTRTPGDRLWSTVNGDPKSGSTNTNAPIVVGDKVYTGVSGGESGVRGFLAAYNINDGSLVWKAYSTGPDDEVLLDKRAILRNSVDVDWHAHDPEENLIFFSTRNPSTWNPVVLSGDNKWSMTLFARDADTGLVKWASQMTPHDERDYDGVNETILADIDINGEIHKLLVHFQRNGSGFILNRGNGQLLAGTKFGRVSEIIESDGEARQRARRQRCCDYGLPPGARIIRPDNLLQRTSE